MGIFWSRGTASAEARQLTANVPKYPADLDVSKYSEYDQLVLDVREFLGGRKFSPLRGFVKERVLRRLLEKLHESSLGEEKVPEIASTVWHDLRAVCGNELAHPANPIQNIADDILHEYNNAMPAIAKRIVSSFIRKYAAYDEKLIAIVVRELWPEIRQQLGV